MDIFLGRNRSDPFGTLAQCNVLANEVRRLNCNSSLTRGLTLYKFLPWRAAEQGSSEDRMASTRASTRPALKQLYRQAQKRLRLLFGPQEKNIRPIHRKPARPLDFQAGAAI
jgi:hypothetical protein